MSTTTCDGLRTKLGELLGTSAWYRIDQGVIDTFARVTHDQQWIHTDPQRAAGGPFGSAVAHGFLTLSMCACFLEDCLTVSDATLTINYGLDRVRFPSAVPVGAQLRGQVELVAVDALDAGVQAVMRITVETDASAKPACVADFVVRYLR